MASDPNVWRRSWKRSRPQLGGFLHGAVAAAKGGLVEIPSVDADEDEVVVACEAFSVE